MRGSSRGSAKAAQAAFDTALAGDAAWETLAEELFAVTGVVDGNASLRRALADPSRDGVRQAGPGPFALRRQDRCDHHRPRRRRRRPALVGRARPGDTLETLAVQALLAAAERERRIDRVEDELFRFERIVAGDPGLRDTLSSRNTDGSGKATPRARAARGQGRAGDHPAGRAGGARAARPAARPGAASPTSSSRRSVVTSSPRSSPSPRRSPSSSTPGCAARSRRTTARPVTPPGRRGPRGHGRHPGPGRRRGRRRHRPAPARRGPPARHRRLTGIRSPRRPRPTSHRTTDHRLRPQRGPVTEEKIRT